MYTMKQACELTGMNYEALKFYCNSELVPAVGRDGRNHRIFDDQAIAWIIGLNCLKRCGLSINDAASVSRRCNTTPNFAKKAIPLLRNARKYSRRRGPSSNNDLPKSKETSTISTKSSSTTTSCLQEKPHPPESLPNSDAGRTAPHANNIDVTSQTRHCQGARIG